MRGVEQSNGTLFSLVSLDDRVPKTHPLRKIRALSDDALNDMDGDLAVLYSNTGRPSIPPECLLRASLLQALYSVRSERQLMEQIDYNLLFRWFVGLSIDEPVWDASTFSKNRSRLMDADIGKALFEQTVRLARKKRLMSSDHFSVDGSLIAGWASQKSVRRKDGNDDDNPDGQGRNASRNFHNEKRSNTTHASRSDPDALLARKGGTASRPSYMGHSLIEHRNGLLVDAELTQATGYAERETALRMALHLPEGSTMAGDRNYDTRDFVAQLRALKITPHVAQNLNRPGGSAIDARTTRHEGYRISQRIRKRVEETFGWAKEVGNQRQTKFRGIQRVRLSYLLTMTAYNLRRLSNLIPA
jgi:transposase